MYLGVLCIIAAWIIFWESTVVLAYFVAVYLLVHLFVVFYEEPTLRRKFGAEYEEYCRRVPRWVPRF